MTELLTRDFHARADAEEGVIEGIAVPWDEPANVGYIEKFARGSITDDGNIKLFAQHREIVGRVIASEDRPEGFWVRAKISDTQAGRDLLALMRDGAIDKFSVGFMPSEHREEEDGTVVRTAVFLREVSAVIWPAYANADVTDVRENPNHNQGAIMTDTATATELRGLIEEVDRKVDLLTDRPAVAATPEVDRRSAGAVLKAIVAGDTETIEAYNRTQETKHDELFQRATNGTVMADVPTRPEAITSLVRLFDSSSGVQSQLFSRGTLPATGMSLEFVELVANTLSVAQQAAEGDTLAFGKLTFANRTAPVNTYGGWTELSRQTIERSSINVVQTSLEGLTIEAGRRKKIELRSVVNSALAARSAVASNGGVVVLGSTLAASAAGNWEDALIDAAIRYDAQAAAPEALVVSASVFKKLRSLTVSGERVFRVAEGNASGTLNLPGLTGSLAGLPVYLDAGQTGDSAYFLNGRAIKQYDSTLYSLSDQNITNLTNSFGVYFYGALAVEVPQLLVPVKLAAS